MSVFEQLRTKLAMTESDQPDDFQDITLGTRRRGKIFGDRVTVSFRMEQAVHDKMMALCTRLQIPANTYVNGLIAADLANRRKRSKK